MQFLRIPSVLLFATVVIASNCSRKRIDQLFSITCRNNATWSSFQSDIEIMKTEVKCFTPSKLLAIFMQSNNLTTIPSDTFANFTELQYLELGNNKIQSIHPEAFKNLKNLTLLNLWRNEIKELSNVTFDGLVSLRTLDLHNNQLMNLPQGIFDILKNLQVVNLSGNRFQFLPGNLFQENQLLNTVRLRFERSLATLPSGLFRNLKNLKIVQLDGSKLESLPENLFQGSTEVREINLDGNSLKSLPKKLVQDLRKLEKLSLSNNQIEHLPDDIFSDNEYLEELKLNYNHIRNLSSSLFSGLGFLKKLEMKNNSISIIDKAAFTNLGRVEEINLSHNNLSDITIAGDDYLVLSVFAYCNRLRTLDLSFNKINIIYSDWITQPSMMFNYLDLSHNHIDRIRVNDMDFKHYHAFHINLSDNKISRIDMNEAFEEIFLHERRSRIEMIMNNNPLQCSCFLYDFVRYLDGSRPKLQKNLVIKVGNLECSSPEEIKGTLLSDLKSKDYRCIASDMEEYEGVCPESCSRWIKPYEHKLVFDCAFKNLTEAPKTMCNFVSDEYKNEVNLTGNFIKNIPNMKQTGYDKVQKLILSHNNISTVTKDVFSPTLLTLALDNNQMSTLSSDVLTYLKNTTTTLTLGGNPWKCDCDSRDFHYYIQTSWIKDTSRILDVEKITCQNSKIVMKTITLNELCASKLEMVMIISLVLAILGLIVCILSILYYRHQREIKIWLYANQKCLWFVTEKELDKEKTYDAFISYSHKDENFVVNELVPKLEEGPRPFKLCIHFRDWLAGEWIPAQIAKSVNDSKRTIVVVSPNFVQSEWGRLEFRAAHSQALKEGRGKVVVILYGDIDPNDDLDPELKSYLSMNTYAKWGDPWFWQKLRYFLPHKSEISDEAPRLKFFRTHQISGKLELDNKSDLKMFSDSNVTALSENSPKIEAREDLLNGNVYMDVSYVDV